MLEDLCGIYESQCRVVTSHIGTTRNSSTLAITMQEAEECMKMLGTYQNHGRLFARVAYGYGNVEQDHPAPLAGELHPIVSHSCPW